jgi:hypothetical protein
MEKKGPVGGSAFERESRFQKQQRQARVKLREEFEKM